MRRVEVYVRFNLESWKKRSEKILLEGGKKNKVKVEQKIQVKK